MACNAVHRCSDFLHFHRFFSHRASTSHSSTYFIPSCALPYPSSSLAHSPHHLPVVTQRALTAHHRPTSTAHQRPHNRSQPTKSHPPNPSKRTPCTPNHTPNHSAHPHQCAQNSTRTSGIAHTHTSSAGPTAPSCSTPIAIRTPAIDMKYGIRRGCIRDGVGSVGC